MKSIPIQGRRFHVIESLGFLKKKKAYVCICLDYARPRTALKTPGNIIWQWAEDDPLTSPPKSVDFRDEVKHIASW